MRKVLSVLVCILLTIPAFATGDATPTSKGYVDAQMDILQDNLPGAAANTVITTTDTAGETGTKSIYDASGNYAEQMDALVTAEDANTAIQMAIQGELVCREYDPTGQYCYVYDVHPTVRNNILPNGYTALEYLESTGLQSIDTGRKLHGTDTVEVKYSNFVNLNLDNMLFGHYSENSFSYNLMQNGIYVYFHNVNGVSMNSIPINDDVHIVKLGNDKFYFDNQLKYAFNRQTDFYTASNSAVFSASGSYRSKAKVYYYKVINISGEVVQHLVPARRDSDGKLGMYDLVSNTFFTNSGTGEFIAGPDLNVYMPNGN